MLREDEFRSWEKKTAGGEEAGSNQSGTIAWNKHNCLPQAFLCQPRPVKLTAFKGPAVG